MNTAARKRKAEAVRALLRSQFRPEFLNRIDEVVVFHPQPGAYPENCDVQLDRGKTPGERRLELELTPAAKDLPRNAAMTPYGARP